MQFILGQNKASLDLKRAAKSSSAGIKQSFGNGFLPEEGPSHAG
jgi:hypothetical protein